MSQPTSSAVHVDAILTQMSVAYIQSDGMFVANKVFPVIPVDKKTDKYFTYTKNDWFRDEAKLRVGGTESAGSGYGLSTATYSCDTFAFHKDVDDETRNNADAPLDMERDATMFVTQKLLLRQEIQWAADNFTTSVWGTDSTPGTLWSDYTASDPIGDIRTGSRTILANTGFLPNTMVLGYDVYIKLLDHPDLVDRIKYSGQKTVTLADMAALFEVDRILVAKAIKAINVENETAAYSFVHGKHALLCYVAPNPGILTPSAGYTFQWKGVSGGLGATVGVKNFRIEQIESTRIEGQVSLDNKVVASDLGYFFNGAVS
jgi:hypothetical protein